MPKAKPTIAPDDEDDEIDQVAEPIVTAKVKKERTPAQKEAFVKAMAILKQKRESKATEEKERFEKADALEKDRIAKEKFEKAKNHKKKLPPAPSYVTTGDLEKFKLDLLQALPRHQPDPVKPDPVKVQPVKAESIKPIIKKEPIVQKTLTGHDLLDKLFFS
jgi:hypothetical protein